MEEKSGVERLSLKNAFNLLSKVLDEGDTTFTKEDWQMLQVAQFLVSKEKFLRRDADNTTLRFDFPQSFYFLDDLCESIYQLAKYVYMNDKYLVVDYTKIVEYQTLIPNEYKTLTNPTFDEALIIVNMIRNSIAHGQAELDFEGSILRIDNSFLKLDGSGDIQFQIKADIPISLLSKIDIGQVMKKNAGQLINCIFEVIARGDYKHTDDGVAMDILFNGKLHSLKLKPEVFSMVLYAYEEHRNRMEFSAKTLDNFDVNKYKNARLSLNKNASFKAVQNIGPRLDDLKRNKAMKDLVAIFELLNNDNKNALDSRIVKKLFELVESDYLPTDVKLEAISHYNAIVNSINFQDDAEKSFDSIAFALGFFRQGKTVDFIALYNYMTLLFANCPLKEGNALLTEFIDLSTISIDPFNTKDNDIMGFYADVLTIMNDFMNTLKDDPQQFSYQRPCINLYTKTIMAIMRKLKLRNNAFIRHIRNAIEHSNISLSGDIVELRDYIENGDELNKTFRSRIHIDNLLNLSVAYSNIYNVETYQEYLSVVKGSDNFFLSFTLSDLFRDLGKYFNQKELNKFAIMLKQVHELALGEEFSFDYSIADLTIKLANVSTELQNKKGKGGK